MTGLKQRYAIQAVLAAAIVSMAAGCADGTDNMRGQGADRGDSETRQNTQAEQETEEKPDASNIFAPHADARSLTAEELEAFETYINGHDNYGFLMSVYDTPAGVNLEEVFYNGAGLSEGRLGEEEKQAYLKAAGQEEAYTDVVHMTGAQIDAFLQEKTGLRLDEMNDGLSWWTYVSEYDTYYKETGDTNYMPFDCVAGSTQDENRFVLQLHPRAQYGGEEADGYHVMECEAVLDKYGDGYRFVSNRMRIEDGQIADQTFETELVPWGLVTFASYEPDVKSNPHGDVTFTIIRDGMPVMNLAGMYFENLLPDTYSFDSVAAVSFPDYNGDGYTDIVAIVNYSFTQGPKAGGSCQEARIYSGSESESFVFEQELSREAGAQLKELTARTVTDFAGENHEKYAMYGIGQAEGEKSYYGVWTVSGAAGTSAVYALTEEEIREQTGKELTYEADSFSQSTWDSPMRIAGYGEENWTVGSFENAFRVDAKKLGLGGSDITQVFVLEEGDFFGNQFYVVDDDTLLIYYMGVFFTAER